MRRAVFLLVAIILVLCLVLHAPAQADGSGNVVTTVNGAPLGPAYICEWNQLMISIQNDAPLYELSLGFAFTTPYENLTFDSTWGDVPIGDGPKYIRTEFAAIGAFDLSGYQVTASMPDSIMISGVASAVPLPASATPLWAFSVRFKMPDGPDMMDGFCVSPIAFSPIGKWEFTDSAPYAPEFGGEPVGSSTNPIAPPQCFEALQRPCGSPDFTSVPDPTVNFPRCNGFQFDVDAEHFVCPGACIEYFTDVGTIDLETGELTVPNLGGCDSTVVTLSCRGCSCVLEHYTFTINWTNQSPDFGIPCYESFHIYPNTTEIVSRSITDADVCDNPVINIHTPDSLDIVSSYTITNGNPAELQFESYPDDTCNGQFLFYYVGEDECGAKDTCKIWFQVVNYISGDPDGNGIISIGDCVYIINYIFGGGSAPSEMRAADASCDSQVSIADAVFIISHIFAGGPPPDCYSFNCD